MILFTLLTGCIFGWNPFGQSGNEDSTTPRCVELDRTSVAADEVADGFTYAPAAVIAHTEGAWAGTFSYIGSAASRHDATLEVEFGTQIEIVHSELVDADPDQDADSSCVPTHYELAATAHFDVADGSFHEALPLVVSATPDFDESVHAIEMTSRILFDDVAGTARPTWDPQATTTVLTVAVDPDETGSLLGMVYWDSVPTAGVEPASRSDFGGFSVLPLE